MPGLHLCFDLDLPCCLCCSRSLLHTSHLGDEQCSHASAGATTERVAELEALEAVAACTSPSTEPEGNRERF